MVDDAVVMRAKPEGDLLLSSSSPGSSSQEVVSRREGLRFLQQRPQRRWIEVTDNVRREYECASSRPECRLQTNLLKDIRPPVQKAVDSFLSRFFPLGYPHRCLFMTYGMLDIIKTVLSHYCLLQG
jgi:hypothetical protein